MAVTDMALRKRLEQIDEAINAVLIGGQEYWHEGRRVTRASLDVLYKYRQQLENQLMESDGGGTSVVYFEGR